MITEQSIHEHLVKRFNVQDPWHFDTSIYEIKRFNAMLDLIKSVPHKSILEVGCAEGHFTRMLTSVSDDVTALDIIPIALERAKKRAPQAKYFLDSIEDFVPKKKYDVVNCSEMINYCPNKRKALDNIQKLGSYLVTSNFILDGWYPSIADRYFWRFPLIKMKVVISLAEMKICLISLRKLS